LKNRNNSSKSMKQV